MRGLHSGRRSGTLSGFTSFAPCRGPRPRHRQAGPGWVDPKADAGAQPLNPSTRTIGLVNIDRLRRLPPSQSQVVFRERHQQTLTVARQPGDIQLHSQKSLPRPLSLLFSVGPGAAKPPTSHQALRARQSHTADRTPGIVDPRRGRPSEAGAARLARFAHPLEEHSGRTSETPGRRGRVEKCADRDVASAACKSKTSKRRHGIAGPWRSTGASPLNSSR
jgi:hypothetical protein